jgi:hypothetical protein
MVNVAVPFAEESAGGAVVVEWKLGQRLDAHVGGKSVALIVYDHPYMLGVVAVKDVVEDEDGGVQNIGKMEAAVEPAAEDVQASVDHYSERKLPAVACMYIRWLVQLVVSHAEVPKKRTCAQRFLTTAAIPLAIAVYVVVVRIKAYHLVLEEMLNDDV